MPHPVPNKLPRIVGNGRLARAFGITWMKINDTIDAIQSLQPMSSSLKQSARTSIGTVDGGGSGTGSQTETDTTARWA